MNKMILMNLTTNIIDTLLIFYFIKKSVYKTINNKAFSTLILIILITLNTLINLNFGLGNMIGFLSIFIISNTVYSFVLDINFLKTLIFALTGTILMFIVEVIVIQSIIILFNILPSDIYELNIYRITAIICAKTMFFLIIKYGIEKIKMPRNFKLKESIPSFVVAFFNIIIIYMTFTLYKYLDVSSTSGYLYLFGMSLGAILFSWVIYSITQKLILQSQQEIIWKMKEEEFQKRDFYIKNMQDTLQTIKAQRHDLNNYISTLYGLIYMERIQEAQQYITKLNDRISYINDIVETNHPIITSLLNIKKYKANQEKINMITNINLPNDLPIDFVDLSIVLGNLFDNAIEACSLIKEGEKVIELSMYIKDNYLIIKIVNSKCDSIKSEVSKLSTGYTSKKDKENHGIGLNNVKNVVDHYNGLMDLEDDGNMFKVNIALSIEKDAA